MPTSALDADARARLCADLEALEGVRRAVLDADPLRVYLVCDRTDAPIEMLVRGRLAQSGIAPEQAEVHVAYLAKSEPRRRVRFVAARLAKPHVGRAIAQVELEWDGETFCDQAEGESGQPLELRLAAAATLRTLEAILRGRMQFTMVGIKSFRAFDTDVIVVLVRADNGTPLVGASLASTDPYRSAALAVLNATNRVLGNYLATGTG